VVINENNVEFSIDIKTLLTWIGKDRNNFNLRFFLDPQTGSISYDASNLVTGFYYCEHVSSYEEQVKNGIYVGFDEKINMLAVLFLELRYSKPINNKPFISKWQEVNRFYIDNKKQLWIKLDKSLNNYKCKGLVRKKSDFPFNINQSVVSPCFESIHKLFGSIVLLSGNTFLSLSSFDDFITFLMYKEPIKKNTKSQMKVNELLEIPLSNISIKDFNIEIDSNFAIVEKVKKGLCVLRTFSINTFTNEMIEGARIYVDKEKCYFCKRNNFGEYIIISQGLDKSHWNFRLCRFRKNDVKDTKLEYLASIIKEIPINKRNIALWSFLKWDIFEKLYKAGYKNLCLASFNVYWGSPFNELVYLLGLEDLENNPKASISSFTKMNKYQQEILDELFKDYKKEWRMDFCDSCSYLRKWFGETLSDIDNNTFDNAIKIIKKADMAGISCLILDVISIIVDIKDFRFVSNNIDRINNFIDKSWNYSFFIFRTYKDYLEMVRHPVLRDCGYKLIFDNKQELENNHDNVICLYNLLKADFDEKAFKDFSKKWKKYEFSDEEYSIIYPLSPQDIVYEANELHHCVKSYIGKVINEETNILFLRKKSELSTPFFTIELENNDNIAQIHGLMNCNIEKKSKEEAFINKWKKEKNLTSKNYNILR